MTTKELLDEIIIEIEKLGIELKTADLHGATAYISPASGWGYGITTEQVFLIYVMNISMQSMAIKFVVSKMIVIVLVKKS